MSVYLGAVLHTVYFFLVTHFWLRVWSCIHGLPNGTQQLRVVCTIMTRYTCVAHGIYGRGDRIVSGKWWEGWEAGEVTRQGHFLGKR